MTIKAIYATQAEVPAEYVGLYEERDSKWVLKHIEGLKTDADVARVQTALEAERRDYRDLKARVKGVTGDKSLDDIQATLDRIPELEAARSGAKTPEEIQALVDAKVQTIRAPLDRQVESLTAQVSERDATIGEYVTKDRTAKIHDAIRTAATAASMEPGAVDDVLMYAGAFDVLDDGQVVTKEGAGATPGLSPDVWLTDMKPNRAHWWPTSQGGGASGSGGSGGFANNPWSKDHWNLTKQGEVIRAKGSQVAGQMATAAGSRVGATSPA